MRASDYKNVRTVSEGDVIAAYVDGNCDDSTDVYQRIEEFGPSNHYLRVAKKVAVAVVAAVEQAAPSKRKNWTGPFTWSDTIEA